MLRRERNQARIVDTCYALVRSGVVEPTADQVAEKAGVGRRTVFRLFQEMEILTRAVNERVAREAMPLAEPFPLTQDLEQDLRLLISQRARLFEHVAPFRRAGVLVRHRSAFLSSQSEMFAAMQRARVEAVVGGHLKPGASDALEALDLLLSFESWERLRQEQHLSVERAAEVVLHSALRIATT